MKPERIKLYRKLAYLLLGIILVSLLFLPFYESFVPLEEEAYWEAVHIYQDEELMILLSPFYLFFPLLLKIKRRIARIIVRTILYLLAFGYFAYAMLATSFAVQDFVPRIGILMLPTFLPLLIYLHYLDSWEKFNKGKENASA